VSLRDKCHFKPGYVLSKEEKYAFGENMMECYI